MTVILGILAPYLATIGKLLVGAVALLGIGWSLRKSGADSERASTQQARADSLQRQAEVQPTKASEVEDRLRGGRF